MLDGVKSRSVALNPLPLNAGLPKHILSPLQLQGVRQRFCVPQRAPCPRTEARERPGERVRGVRSGLPHPGAAEKAPDRPPRPHPLQVGTGSCSIHKTNPKLHWKQLVCDLHYCSHIHLTLVTSCVHTKDEVNNGMVFEF